MTRTTTNHVIQPNKYIFTNQNDIKKNTPAHTVFRDITNLVTYLQETHDTQEIIIASLFPRENPGNRITKEKPLRNIKDSTLLEIAGPHAANIRHILP